MKTITERLGRAVFMAAATLFLCGAATARDNVRADNLIAQAGTTAQNQQPRRTLRHPRRTQPLAPTPPLPAGRLMDKSYFGMHIHNADTITPWPPVTFGFLRLWDTGTDWASLEPARGTWNFTRLDKLVTLAQEHGVDVVLTLGMTPGWASARPSEACPYGSGCAAEPTSIVDWQDYVRTVVSRYTGRIKYYEIWNEPIFDPSFTGTRFFTGTPAKMVELASSAYAVIKQNDPGASVLSPAAVYPVSYLEPFLQDGGGKTFDILATHYYVIPPELLPQAVNDLKALLTKYGVQSKPMWNTEAGYNNTRVQGSSQPWYVFDVPTAAAYAARHLILGASSGLGRSALYAWDNSDMGFITPSNYQLNAEGVAYGTVATWLIGSGLQTCAATGASLWQCEIDRGQRRAWIVWSTVPDTAFQTGSLPAPIKQVITLDGHTSLVIPVQLSVGLAPTLLVSDPSPW